jgi:hypothetical protein
MGSLPLSLGDILHEEYVRLYGPAEPLPKRWTMEGKDIVDAKQLARKITERFDNNPPKNFPDWRGLKGYDAADKDRVAEAVNGIFDGLLAQQRWLFEEPAFEDAKKAPYDAIGDASDYDANEVYNVNRQMFDLLFGAETRSAADAHYATVIARIHKRAKDEKKPRTALSISGGGIRSATFALGVMQGLAKRGLLEQFDFLSTVSGGGYIGSWLSSWTRRDAFGIRGVSAMLTAAPPESLEPEPLPLRHLRAFSNYLTPKLGFLSADTWALVATYLRNLLLNWIVLIPLLAGVLAIPRLFVAAVMHPAKDVGGVSSTMLAAFAGGLLLLWALGYQVAKRPVADTKDEKKNALTDGSFITRCLLPFMGGAFALMLAWAWYLVAHAHDELPKKWFFVASIGLCLLAWLMFFWRYFAISAGARRDSIVTNWPKTLRLSLELVAAIAAGALGGILAWGLTRLFDDVRTPMQLVGAVRWPIDDPGSLSAATAMYVCFAVPLVIGVLFLQCALFVGIASQQNHDFDREWWARASGWVLIGGLAWAALCLIAIYGPVAVHHLPKLLSAAGGGAGIFSLLAGRSSKTSSSQSKSDASTSSTVTNLALGVAVPVFVLWILALISTGTTWALQKTFPEFKPADAKVIATDMRRADVASRTYPAKVAARDAKIVEKPLANVPRLRSIEHLRLVQNSDPWALLLLVIGLPAVALFISRFIGVNVFSMHAMYRNRLVRAYLGASRWSRSPNLFTGFDADDNLSMHDLRPEYLWAYSFRDADAAYAAISKAPAGTPLGKLWSMIQSQVDKDPGTTDGRARALVQALNTVIATENLAGAADPAQRPLLNRRFIEKAFDDTVYPSPMPLVCAGDLLIDQKTFLAQFGATLLGEVNDIIATKTLATDPKYKNLTIDATPFTWSKTDGVHRMIDNRLRVEALLPKTLKPLAHERPLHVINVTLNLTSGSDLAWQERKAESMTVSPLASGSYHLGYRDSREYAEISVGTAVTISGAAASPNMGYHSSPALAFLMTLFNVRLGWWLGNPGLAGNDTYKRRNPRYSMAPFLREATGNSDDTYGYVYLSDGGHFENLGIYEMVLRRCHCIVVSDAGADPTYIYDDLGNAIRKVRIDLGVPIDIDRIGIIPPDKKKRTPEKYCAVGTINYKAVDGDDAVNGRLLYIKPVVYKDGPRDVLNYAMNSPTFPHETTGDQFFSESQFESYRRLGQYAVDQIAGGAEFASICALVESAEDKIKPVS